jgi:hypothetical protein
VGLRCADGAGRGPDDNGLPVEGRPAGWTWNVAVACLPRAPVTSTWYVPAGIGPAKNTWLWSIA